ncbi:hypothetical protein BDV93DRAFT_564962 [Ceratobasidium sp. AG-I]|nr:hypothetical protein BDV93DRAFT_564962 [Ceratobasidium sp. AG-I]
MSSVRNGSPLPISSPSGLHLSPEAEQELANTPIAAIVKNLARNNGTSMRTTPQAHGIDIFGGVEAAAIIRFVLSSVQILDRRKRQINIPPLLAVGPFVLALIPIEFHVDTTQSPKFPTGELFKLSREEHPTEPISNCTLDSDQTIVHSMDVLKTENSLTSDFSAFEPSMSPEQNTL